MKSIKNLVLSALFLSLGLVMPFLTMQIREIGSMLLPMHIPILVCGFVCGWKYGLLVGFITPLLRSFIFTMPTLFPNAVSMAFELATYGAIVGILYYILHSSKLRIYLSLLVAMFAGRCVWGIVMIILSGISKSPFSWQMFIGGTLLNAIPGIILQLVLIPILVFALEKAGVMNVENK
ncbi:MAG: ECF transporter S component [Lachnospiraceae bacterium]|jgi:riboflavin transporter FmnP|nr:ECF transporter S component [Lachnospiraceae bacterium]